MQSVEVCGAMIIVRYCNPFASQAVITNLNFIDARDMIECPETAIISDCEFRREMLTLILFPRCQVQLILKATLFSY